MEKIRMFLDKLLYTLAGATFLAMVALTCWQVFTRYLLKDPSPWSEELVSYLFGWMALIGASIVTGEQGHMNIPALVERQRPAVRKCLLLLAEAIAFAFSAVIFVYGGIKITSLTMGQLTSSLGVAVGVFYTIMPVCGVLNMAYILLNMADILRKEAV